MSAPPIVRDLVVAHTRVLKLPGVARTFEGLARQARDAHWPHEDYLHEVLSAEQASRHESVIRQRLHEARFPQAVEVQPDSREAHLFLADAYDQLGESAKAATACSMAPTSRKLCPVIVAISGMVGSGGRNNEVKSVGGGNADR